MTAQTLSERPLWTHQAQAVERARGRDNFGLFFEVGTGKTLTAIKILEAKFQAAGKFLPTLILGPPIILQNWKRELEAHSTIPPSRVVVVEGSKAQRLKKIADALRKHGRGVVLIANYEALLTDQVFEALRAWRPSCLIGDESHRLKTPKAKRTRAVVELADFAQDLRLILTGTPVLNSPMDLYAQYRIMDQGQSFGRSFTSFKNKYFYDANLRMAGTQRYFPDWRARASTLQEMNEIIKRTAMYVKKSECLDLPPLVRKTVAVEMSPLQKRLYKEIKEDLIAFLGDKACTAPIALTKALRLQQIVSGYVALEGEENVSLKDNPRAKALSELLETLAPTHKVIVWAVFRPNYQTIREVLTSLGIDYVEVHGEISAAEKQASVDRFNTDAKCRVLLGHPGSGGIGINLTAASYSVFYSRSFSLEHDIQAEARNYRGGSERHESITRIDLVAEGTIDEIVLKALAGKQAMGEKLLETLKERL